MTVGFSHYDQHEALAKEAPMKVTKRARLRKIAKIVTLGILSTVAGVAVAIMAATSG